MRWKGTVKMEYVDYYVDNYKRLVNSISVNEDIISSLEEKLEKRIQAEKNIKKKQIMVASAAIILIGAGIKFGFGKKR